MPVVLRLKKQHKTWFYVFLSINVIVLLLAAVSNPYRLLPALLTVPGINDIKPRLYDRMRYIKLFDIAQQKPRTVILGSSRVLWGIDPKNRLLEKYQPIYNAGVLGPPMYEIREYFYHALANQPELKRVILALDFYAFNAKFDGRDLILRNTYGRNVTGTIQSQKEMLFDFGAMFESLFYSAFRIPVKSLREDGRLMPDPLSNRELYKDFFNPIALPVVKGKSTAAQQSSTKPAARMKDELYGDFQISKQGFQALEDIIGTCKERNIELYIYITPTLQNSESNAFLSLGIWKDFQEFQRRLSKLHSFWDFTGLNSITRKRENFIDGSHHTFAVGDVILARLFNVRDPKIPHSFGRYVDGSNVEEHLRIINKEATAT